MSACGHRFDVGVVGGGPAGAATALALSRWGCRVLVLNAGRDGGFQGGESLPPQANPVLARLGLLELLRDGPHLPCYGNQSAWGTGDLVDTDFLFSPNGHGWHLDRAVFDRQLLELAREAGASVVRPARLEEARPLEASRGGGWHFSWRRESSETATPVGSATVRFVVDASGLARVFLKRRGVRTHHIDRLVAIVATFAPPKAPDAPDAETERDSRSLIQAVADGWWYTGLLPGGRRLAILFTDADEPLRRACRRPAGFAREVSRARFVADRLRRGDYRWTSLPVIRSAASSRPARTVGKSWLAVGDAAGSFDPLSAQGLTSALVAAERAVGAVRRNLERDPSALEDYETYQSETYRDYLLERCRHYRLERRWPWKAFWRRRHRPCLPRIFCATQFGNF